MLKFIKVLSIFFACSYILTAFMNADINYSNWGEGYRVFAVTIASLLTFAKMMLDYLNGDDEPKMERRRF